MTHDEMITMIQAHKEGKKIEVIFLLSDSNGDLLHNYDDKEFLETNKKVPGYFRHPPPFKFANLEAAIAQAKKSSQKTPGTPVHILTTTRVVITNLPDPFVTTVC